MNTDIDVSNELKIEEVGILRKNFSGIIDAAIVLTIFLSVALSLPMEVLSKLQGPVPPELYIFVLLAIYRLLSFMIFAKTVGMRICGIQILNGDLENTSHKENVCVSFFVLINGVSFYRRG